MAGDWSSDTLLVEKITDTSTVLVDAIRVVNNTELDTLHRKGPGGLLVTLAYIGTLMVATETELTFTLKVISVGKLPVIVAIPLPDRLKYPNTAVARGKVKDKPVGTGLELAG